MKKLNNSPDVAPVKQQYARLDFFRTNPQIAALSSKIVGQGNESESDRNRRLKHSRPSDQLMSMVSSEISQNIKDTDLIFQLLPEMVLVEQILTSSILSPKDLTLVELNYINVESKLPSELTALMLEPIRKHFDSVYKIKAQLPEMIKDPLFRTGSYPLAILPESTIDKVINSTDRASMESISDNFGTDGELRQLGYLGSPNPANATSMRSSLESICNEYSPTEITLDHRKLTHSAESVTLDFHIEVSDNYQILKMPSLRRKAYEDKVQDIIAKNTATIGLEAFQDEALTDKKIENSFYRHKPNRHDYIVRLEEPDILDRNTIGHPLTIKLPSESCIPVHVPGNPRDHLGYFVILDETGNPINNATSTDYYRQMGTNLTNSSNSTASYLLKSVDANMNGYDPMDLNKMRFQETVALYSNIIEKDLLTRLKNGIYGDDVQISKASEIYRIMLSRTLVNKKTRLLFIPKTLLTYFAFDYNDYGVGVSLTEKTKIISSIRAVMLFSNTMASIKNSIGRRSAKITLDPKDKNPIETVEYMLHEFAKHNRSSFPIGNYNPTDIISYLANAGVDVVVTGNAGYPETSFDLEAKQNSNVKPDTDLEESLKKKHIQGFGIAPETVELSLGADFATSITTSSLLLSKQVMMYQEILTENLSSFIGKYTLSSGSLIEELKKILIDNKDKIPEDLRPFGIQRLIHQFVATIRATLPAPDSAKLENQMKAYDLYKEALEKALEAHFSTDFLDEASMGDLSTSIESTKNAYKAYFLRAWLSENNVLPELTDITVINKDGEEGMTLALLMDRHIEAVNAIMKPYVEKLKKRVEENAGMDVPEGDTTDTTDTSSDTSSDDTGSVDDAFAEDLGLDTDVPADDSSEVPTDEVPKDGEVDSTDPIEDEADGKKDSEPDATLVDFDKV